ncbi:7102_t:CDS:2, partial [Scutellospora calospora]
LATHSLSDFDLENMMAMEVPVCAIYTIKLTRRGNKSNDNEESNKADNKEGEERVEGSEEGNNEGDKNSEEIKDYKEADKASDEDSEEKSDDDDDDKEDDKEDNNRDIKRLLFTLSKRSSKSKFTYPDIINQSIILTSITYNASIDKIEINPSKKTATIKNNQGKIILEPINLIEIRKSIMKIEFPKFERVSEKEQINQDLYPVLGYFVNFESSKKHDILTRNKLKISKLYHEFLAFESELSVIAPFYDSNSNIKKNDYYKSVLEYLKELTILRRSSIVQFDTTQISGALTLNIEDNQNLNSEYNQDLLNQLMLLRCKPQIPQELRVSSFLKNNSLEQLDAIKKQLDTFFALMSTCYQTIFDEWTMKFTSRDKGTKSATQVRALLIGKESPYNIFN